MGTSISSDFISVRGDFYPIVHKKVKHQMMKKGDFEKIYRNDKVLRVLFFNHDTRRILLNS